MSYGYLSPSFSSIFASNRPKTKTEVEAEAEAEFLKVLAIKTAAEKKKADASHRKFKLQCAARRAQRKARKGK